MATPKVPKRVPRIDARQMGKAPPMGKVPQGGMETMPAMTIAPKAQAVTRSSDELNFRAKASMASAARQVLGAPAGVPKSKLTGRANALTRGKGNKFGLKRQMSLGTAWATKRKMGNLPKPPKMRKNP